MKNKVPHIVKGMPTSEPFLRMEESTRQGRGRPQKPKSVNRRHRNKHGRQHP